MKNIFLGVILMLLILVSISCDSSVSPNFNDSSQEQFESGLKLYNQARDAEALALFESSAELGDINAQYILGGLYEYGVGGVLKDYTKSVFWYRMAANQGNIYCQYKLGRLYSDGQKIDKNYKKAIKWYSLAAEQGMKEAKDELQNLLSVEWQVST